MTTKTIDIMRRRMLLGYFRQVQEGVQKNLLLVVQSPTAECTMTAMFASRNKNVVALSLRSNLMKTSPLPVSESEAQYEDTLLRTAKFQCHGAYVIGFNALLAAVIYGSLMYLR